MTIKSLIGKCHSGRRREILIFYHFSRNDSQVSSVTQEAPKIPTATVTPFETHNQSYVGVTAEPAGDFNEDPFKNYRYEDPYLIEDPFQDVAASSPAPAVTKGSF